MSLLYQLRHLVRFCQIIGAIPYSMEIADDRKSSRSKCVKLSFSWRKPITWWFTIVITTNLTVPVISLAFFNEASLLWDLPKVTLVITCFIGISTFIIVAVSRWIVLQPKKWNRIIRLIHKMDVILAYENLSSDRPNGIKWQVFTSVSLVTGMVSRDLQ